MFLSLLFNTTFAQTQTWNCVESTNPNAGSFSSNSTQTPPTSTVLNFTPDEIHYPDSFHHVNHTYKVVFHIIRDDYGNRANFVGEEIVMNVIRDLNKNFRSARIYFKYGGFEYVDSTALSGNHDLIGINSTFINYLNDTTSFHMIIINGELVDGYDANSNPITVPGHATFYGGISYYSYQGITSKRVPSHEVGHNFSLKHSYSEVENVTRFINGAGYNADYYGDNVHDTPACKIWSNDQFTSAGIYVGVEIDNNSALPSTSYDRLYKSQSPKINNLMYLHQGEDLAMDYEFTPGQINKMRYYISLDINNNYFNYYNASVPWQELFKPFERRNVEGITIASITDNNNGTAEVCRGVLQMNRFQKGFSLNFYDENNAVFITSDIDELKEITSPISNYYTDSEILYPDHFETIAVPCIRGTICETEAYVGGQIISTQILGSMNLTVKELNEIEVTNPNLFNELMSQYYHILKKITSSGAVDQKIIFKQ